MEYIVSDDTSSVCSSNTQLSNNSITPNFINNMTVESACEFEQAVFESIDEYTNEHIGKMHLSNFHANLIQDIAIYFFELLIDYEECLEQDSDYEYIECFVRQRAELFFDTISSIPNRSCNQIFKKNTIDPCKLTKLTKHISYLQSLPQPEQRTKEWYEFRHNLITASSLGKLFGSDSLYNFIICEKCKPIDYDSSLGNCSIDSPMHWGTKYEPLTVMLYEKIYKTKIADFGCIKHSTYPCIGASPDGINIDLTSPLYGRMLEIKNIVNREISGIPLDSYWIQMQGQMETCDLDECDFIETQFKEYEESEFYSDLSHQERGIVLYFVKKQAKVYTSNNVPTNNSIRVIDLHSTGSAKQLYARETGIELMSDKELNSGNFGADSNINQFKQYNIPHYVFMPLSIELNKNSIDQWINTKKTELKDTYTLYTTQYWYLEKMSCVLVQRNKAWFSESVSKIVDAWKIIEKERVSGWEHRLPKKYRSILI